MILIEELKRRRKKGLAVNPKRPYIFHVRCKRCGKMVVSSRLAMTHPLGQICSGCTTSIEKEEIMQFLSGHILKKGRRGKNPITAKMFQLKKPEQCSLCNKPIKDKYIIYDRGNFYHLRCFQDTRKRNPMLTEKTTSIEVFAKHFAEGLNLPIKSRKAQTKFHLEAYKYGDPFRISAKKRYELFEKGIVV